MFIQQFGRPNCFKNCEILLAADCFSAHFNALKSAKKSFFQHNPVKLPRNVRVAMIRIVLSLELIILLAGFLPIPAAARSTPFPFQTANDQPSVRRQAADNTVPPGGSCSFDTDCAGYPYAECRSTCQCTTNAVNAGSKCVRKEEGDQSNCPAGEVYVSEAGICMPIAKPGAPCQYTQQCSGTEVGAFCIQMRCRCVYGMLATPDGKCSKFRSTF